MIVAIVGRPVVVAGRVVAFILGYLFLVLGSGMLGEGQYCREVSE